MDIFSISKSNVQQYELLLHSAVHLYLKIYSEPPYNEKFEFDIILKEFYEYVNDGLLLLATDDDNVIGFLATSFGNHCDEPLRLSLISDNINPAADIYFSEFGVDINYRGKGIGSDMLNRMLEYYKYRLVYLRTAKNNNDKIINYYSKFGFIVTNTVEIVFNRRVNGEIDTDERIYMVRRVGNEKKMEPEALWKHFFELTKIPRPSKRERKMIEFLRSFAIDNNFFYFIDNVGNVIIKKSATLGMENHKTVILQGHVDMVTQKNTDKIHDFEKDPIETYIENGWVKARGTTLGADNGIGVAAILAVLESKTIQHGPLEALFTVDEETGLTGALGLDRNCLSGDILLNLDSEDIEELCIGCAGGTDVNIEFNYTKCEVDKHDQSAFRLSITGLKGGHSGVDINLGRANAIKLLFRFLYQAMKFIDIRISKINGGSLMNGIPREAFADVVLKDDFVDSFIDLLEEYHTIYIKEYEDVEPDLSFKAEEIEIPDFVIDRINQYNLLRSVYSVPNNVIKMSTTVKNLVETSSNLAVIKTGDSVITVGALLRSSVDSAKIDLENVFESIFSLAHVSKINFSGRYSGWRSNINSEILKLLQEVYNDKFNKPVEVKAVHAGLECGVIGGLYPKLDMISFGPTIKDAHSPDEKVEIKSVKMFWDFLIEVLKNIPLK